MCVGHEAGEEGGTVESDRPPGQTLPEDSTLQAPHPGKFGREKIYMKNI